MKTNNTRLKEHKRVLGERLTEVMSLKPIDRTQLRKLLENDYSYPISRQNFAKYQDGDNWMPEDFIEKVSEILDIDKGYLLGNDNCFTKTYAEYIDYMQLMEDSTFSTFDRLLSYADIHISSEKDIVSDGILYSASYTKGKKRNCKEFASEDAELFIKLASEKIKELFDNYISYDNPPLGNSIEAWTDFLYWHPSFFDREENQYYLSKEEIAEIKKNTENSDRTE